MAPRIHNRKMRVLDLRRLIELQVSSKIASKFKQLITMYPWINSRGGNNGGGGGSNSWGSGRGGPWRGGGGGRGEGGGGRGTPWGGGGSWATEKSPEEEESEKTLDAIRELFRNDTRFTCENPLGDIHNGAAMIIKEECTVEGQPRVRRFVVKAGISGAHHSVRKETRHLNSLAFAEHIPRIIAFQDHPLMNLGVPLFVSEYLEHGTLSRFQERLRRADQVLPNRILWSIFLCRKTELELLSTWANWYIVIRACIGMAWPPPGPNVEPEQTRPDDPTTLAHNDMHNENLVFGDLDVVSIEPNSSDHSLMPILKLINFGESVELPEGTDEYRLNETHVNQHDRALNLAAHRRNRSTDKNVLDVGVNMSQIISQRRSVFPNEARALIRDPDIHPSLDPDLRLLVQRCIAVDPLNRPTLDELMELFNNSYFNRPASYYGAAGEGDGLESDETIRKIVSTYILSADTS
ncbi:hypothetical protein F4813DRAFT_388507 [Daldinia decipiens]|uniref:uncharacterized protein n=1 Tax=Daldinia decipiens TaxID=326647 RepID=UPI0020C1C617|nr:uncharacterized protein F4813DRAFT_388507 [Daldinia decipiens]KAI1658740.1 hypothetical protein F4813DRAFT_388507 [Daldinia decipiens]